MMWTADDVQRAFEDEQRELEQVHAQQRAAFIWIRECIVSANEWYLEHHDRVETDFHMGIIGPEGQPKKFDRNQWIAGEVRRRCLTQLDRETPIRKDGEM